MLARLLDKYLAPKNSVLAEAFARQVGETSPFFRTLSPTESTGLVMVLEDLKTTRGGLDFEDSVLAFVRAATQGAACLFEVTGATAGVGRCKKGDAVVRFTPESAFAGAGVVFEAKRDASYTIQKALDELDAARKNRVLQRVCS